MVRKANINDIEAVTAIYEHIQKMEADGLVRIGWNPSTYPVRATAEEALRRGDLFVYEQEGTIMASAIINRTQVPVYATGQWAFPAADLKAAYPDVNWKEGKLLNRVSKKDLEDWVEK